ncbi:MAG: LPS-assembly protein LptD [Chlorobiaceae bacterium]|nr:LPS-assembly protein LptD [Chlorobiaceae bacterium]
MRFFKSLKILSLVLFVNLTEGIMPARAVDGQKPLPGKGPASSRPDSLTKKKDDLDSTVVYTAKDSLIYNFDKRSADLFGKARVDYKEMKLTGPRITVDHVSRTVHSQASADSSGKPVERPVFTDKAGTFTAESMTYNYRTRKGYTSNVTSRDAEGIYSGYQVKRLPSGVMYIRDGIYTTCDDEEPHYWFAGKNMKVIPNDRLVARPMVMWIHPEIFHWRLPKMPLLPLPFMSVPTSNQRASGFLIPKIGSDGKRGTVFSSLGYFFAFNDYVDLRLESDYAINGSWRFAQRFRYKSLNSFSGSIENQNENYVLNHPDDPNYAEYKNRYTRIIHHQQFDPTAKLDLNLQYISGDRYYDINSINPESIITQQATSYGSFSKSWDEGNRVLSLGYQRVSSLTSENITENVTGSLYQSRIYPFRPMFDASTTDWRSRLSIQPGSSFSGQFSDVVGVNTALYTGTAGMNVNYVQDFAPGYKATFTQGINLQGQYRAATQQGALSGNSIQLPFTVQSTLFRYLNLNPSVTYTRYHVNSTVRYDSGTQSLVTVNQPEEYATTVFSVSAQTRLYGAMDTGPLEGLIGLKAIRHTFIPTLTFTANPDYQGTGYNYYGAYQAPDGSVVRYNRFGSSLYNNVLQEQRTIGISIQNLINGKFRSRGGTADPATGEKTLQLLSVTAATSYNFAAETFPLAPLTLTASSNALSPGFLMSAGGTYDFYAIDLVNGKPENGYRINTFNSDVGNGLLRFVTGYINMSMSVSGTLRDRYDVERDSRQSVLRSDGTKVEQAIFRDQYSTGEVIEFSPLLPWSLRASLYLVSDRSNPLTPTRSALLNTSGRLALSRHWQAGFTTGYDMVNRDFIFPALILYRDLHDFQFRFQWVPSGLYRSYQLEIAMKPAQLRDLRYNASTAY